MAKKIYLDEIRGMQTTNYREDKLNTAPAQVEPDFTNAVWRNRVENVPYPQRTQTQTKSTTTKQNNSYKPSRTTKNSTVSSGEYAVKKGDSLWKIAQQHGTTVDALRKANPEIKGNMIYAGQIINLGNKTTNTNTNTNTNTTKNNITENNNSNYKGTVFKNKTNTNTNNNVNYQNQPNLTYESNENLYNNINDVNDTPAVSRLRNSLIFGRPSVKIKAKEPVGAELGIELTSFSLSHK